MKPPATFSDPLFRVLSLYFVLSLVSLATGFSSPRSALGAALLDTFLSITCLALLRGVARRSVGICLTALPLLFLCALPSASLMFDAGVEAIGRDRPEYEFQVGGLLAVCFLVGGYVYVFIRYRTLTARRSLPKPHHQLLVAAVIPWIISTWLWGNGLPVVGCVVHELLRIAMVFAAQRGHMKDV